MNGHPPIAGFVMASPSCSPILIQNNESTMRPHSIADCASHIIWTISNSPKAFQEARDILHELRVTIVNAELRHKEEESRG